MEVSKDSKTSNLQGDIMSNTIEKKRQQTKDFFVQELRKNFNQLLEDKLDEMDGIKNPDDINWPLKYTVAATPVIPRKFGAGPIAIELDISQAAQNMKQVYDERHQIQKDFAMHKILEHFPDLAALKNHENRGYYLNIVEELGKEIADIYSEQIIEIDSASRENTEVTAKYVALRMLTHLSSACVSPFDELKNERDKIQAKLREGIFKGEGNKNLKGCNYTWGGVHPWSVEGFLTRTAMTVPGVNSYHCDTDKEKYGEILIRLDQIKPGHPLFGCEHRGQDARYTSVHANNNLFKTKAAGLK